MQAVLRDTINPDDPDFGESVIRFAARAEVSTRTIYRVLSGSAGTTTSPASMVLDTADRLITAAGRHLNDTRALLPSGLVVDYWDA